MIYLRKKMNLILIIVCICTFIVIRSLKTFKYDPRLESPVFSGINHDYLGYPIPIGSEQHDPELISYLREKVIVPPSYKPYNLQSPLKKDFSQHKQGEFLYNYFKNKKNGTFIEVGAYDGESFSNTLILERELGWTGLLIEPNPLNYEKIPPKNRRAHHAQCCLSITPRASNMTLSIKGLFSTLVTDRKNIKKVTNVVNCYPLYSMMVAANLTTLDLLSIDIESFEVKVLKTIPWDKVNIRALIIEFPRIPEGPEYLQKYMEEQNYTLYKKLRIDYFFVKN